MRAQPMSITPAPDEPLGMRRIQLAMGADEALLGVDSHQRTVHCSPPRSAAPLAHAEVDEDVEIARCPSHLAHFRAVELDCGLQISRVGARVLRIAEAAATAEHDPEGIAAQERLGEGEQVDRLS